MFGEEEDVKYLKEQMYENFKKGGMLDGLKVILPTALLIPSEHLPLSSLFRLNSAAIYLRSFRSVTPSNQCVTHSHLTRKRHQKRVSVHV
jgi:hypothetical protein